MAMAATGHTVSLLPETTIGSSASLNCLPPKKQRVRVLAKTNDSSGTELKTEAKPAAADGGLVRTWLIDSYHQYKAWPEVHKILTQRNLKSVEWQEAHEMAKAGDAILIDVREAQDFEKIHAQGAFSAPLFRLIQGNDFKANLRRFGYALLTEFAGTERNPDFINQALKSVDGDKDKQVVLICDIGGTLSTIVERKGPKAKKYADPERVHGRASRSLKAAYELQEAGFTNVTYLTGGLKTWLYQNLPSDGSDD